MDSPSSFLYGNKDPDDKLVSSQFLGRSCSSDARALCLRVCVEESMGSVCSMYLCGVVLNLILQLY